MTIGRRSLLTCCLFVGSVLVFTPTVHAATVFVSPSTGKYTVGQSVNVTVLVNSQGQSINAGEATVTWSSATLQFISVSSSGSIFKYWPIDPVVQSGNRIIFSGGLPNPGFTGTAGSVLHITFQAKTAGTGTVAISGGKILANDGQGTDVLSGQGSASYTITSATVQPVTPVSPVTPAVPNRPTPTISSSTHPNSSAWYQSSTVNLQWSVPTGLQGVSYIVTNDPSTVPPETITTTKTTATILVAADGLWYVHLRGKYADGWSSTAHFALHVAAQPPAEFTPKVVQGTDSSSGNPTLTFKAVALTDSIVRYTYALDGGQSTDTTETSVDLSGITAGQHTVSVIAVDQAGNTRTETMTFVIVGYATPVLTSVSSPLLLLDPLVVRGIANAGDTVSLYLNGHLVGQVVAGRVDTDSTAAGANLRVPWVLTADAVLKPGTYSVTATATSTTGQVSAPTKSRTVQVVGQALMLNGRPVATFSVAVPIVIVILALLALIVSIMARLGVSVWLMHRRESTVEAELETLRDVNNRQPITREQLDMALTQIEEDVAGSRNARRHPVARRRPSKRSR